MFDEVTRLRQLISDLKEDGERLANDVDYTNEEGDEVCRHCSVIKNYATGKYSHTPTCPITLHTKLYEKIEKAGI